MEKIADDKTSEAVLRRRAAVLQKELGIPVKINVEENLAILELQEKNSFDGKPEIRRLYGFTEKTRTEFKKMLKNYDKEKAENLINRIDSDVGNFLAARYALRNRQDLHVKRLENVINKLDRANRNILKIYSGRIRVPLQPKHSYPYKFENPNDPFSGDIFEEVKGSCYANARIAFKSLQDLIRNLKSAVSIERRKRSRPRADEDDLAFQIAMWFKEFIGQPRPLAGPFPKIVQEYFQICGIKGDIMRRDTIQSALKKLSSSFPKIM